MIITIIITIIICIKLLFKTCCSVGIPPPLALPRINKSVEVLPLKMRIVESFILVTALTNLLVVSTCAVQLLILAILPLEATPNGL
jgi:hypothetical protein